MYKHNASIKLAVKFAETQIHLLLLRQLRVSYANLPNRKPPVETTEGILLSYFETALQRGL